MSQRLPLISILAPLLYAVGIASAQPGGAEEALPPRAFQRIGATHLRHGSQIMCLAYSPDGRILAAGGGHGPLRLWNPQSGALLREISEPWAQAIAFSSSGETMAYASLQKTIRLWNFKLNAESGRLDGHKAPIKALTISPDRTAIASGSQDGLILLWDMSTKKKIAELKGHTDEVTALVYTPDNTLLISAGSDHRIQFWSAATNQVTRKLDAGCGVCALAVSADGHTLYSAGDDNLIRRWDIATGKKTGTYRGHEGIVVSLIDRGDTLISGALDGTIRTWDAKTTKLLRTLPRRPGDCSALAATSAGDFVATAGTNNAIRIFETASGKETISTPKPHAGLTNLTMSPDYKNLASVALDGRILVWQAHGGKLLREWDCKDSGEIVVAYAPDGKTLTTAAERVCFWNPDTGVEIGQVLGRSGDPVVALAYSPDGRTLAIGRRSSQIELWDVEQKKFVRTFKYEGSLHAVAWSPNGKYLAAAGMGKIMLWDPQTSALFKSFDAKDGPAPVFPLVASLAFGPDSRTLAAGCFDATIRVYNLFAKNPTGSEEHHICEVQSMPYAIAYSPDGRTLVSGSFDKTVRLWEAFSGKQIAQFNGHIGPVMGVAFAGDGRSVYSAGAEGTILQWDVPGLAGQGRLDPLAAGTMSVNQMEDLWKTLATEETPRGHQAMWLCIAGAKEALPFFAKKLYLLEPERVKRLFRDLDSTNYQTRLAAMKELENYGRWMEGRYNTAMANPPSLEYKRRVETLKERLYAANSPSLAQERLRVRRFMLLCEQIGGPEAIEALKNLAEKGPEDELQEEAKGSLRRLTKKNQ